MKMLKDTLSVLGTVILSLTVIFFFLAVAGDIISGLNGGPVHSISAEGNELAPIAVILILAPALGALGWALREKG